MPLGPLCLTPRTLLALCLLPAAGAGAAASKFTIRGAGFGHGVGMSQYGAYGFAKNGSGYRDILAHYYTGTAIGNLDPAKRVRVLLQSTGHRRLHAARPARAAAGSRPARPTTCAAAEPRSSCSRRAASGWATYSVLHVTRSRGAVRAARPRGQRPRLGRLPRRARLPRRRVLGRRRRQLPAARQLPAGRRARRVAAVVADRGAEGPGRGGPHLRRRDDEARRRPSTSTPTRARRSTAASPPRWPRRTRRWPPPAARSSPTPAQPVVTFFFSTSGGRTEDVENTPLGNEPRPWLKSVDDPYDDTSPRHRWGPIRMSLKQAGRKLGSAVKGSFRGIEVVRRGRSPRIVEADVIGTPRPHPRDRRAAARALRPVRLVGVLHLDHHRRRAAAGADARGPGRADRRHRPVRVGGAARRQPRRRRGGRARAARPARRARDAAAARRRRAGVTVGSTRLRGGGRYSASVTSAGVYRVRYHDETGPAVRVR